MQRITPFLWFDDQAEEAANFYVSIFKNAKINKTALYPEGSPGPVDKVMIVEFELDGQKFVGLNGGPHFNFNEAVSFSISCETQEELDYSWNKLLEGGQESQCGWLKDKYGLSWQVVPRVLAHYFEDKDPERSRRVMQAMLKMKKLDIGILQKAYDKE